MMDRYLESLDIQHHPRATLSSTDTIQPSTSHPNLAEGRQQIKIHKEKLFLNKSSPSVVNRRTFNYVNILVSGYHFKTLEETLARFPDTLLGNPKRRQKYWDEERSALVFHRCRQSFESILYFYQSGGSIIQPINVEQDIFLEEAKFFKLPLLNYFMLEELEQSPRKKRVVKRRTEFLERFYTMVEDSNTIGWKALALFDVGMTFVFVALRCLRTEKSLKDEHHQIEIVATETMCIVWFLGIFSLRLLIAPSKKHFLFQFMSLVDVAVILSFLIDFTIFIKIPDPEEVIPGVITCLRLTGFLRLFNMARYSELLFCLGVALKRSLADLAQVMVLIFLVTFIFATLAYYIEEDDSNSNGHTPNEENHKKYTTFESVFDALYWGTITIATVGYGDIYPKTPGGKSVGAALALLGLPLIAIPMPLIMSKFDGYYQDIKRKKENNEVRDKLMEDMREREESDEEDRAHWDEANGKKLHDILVKASKSTTSLTEGAALSPAERSNMSWNEIVKEGYGFAFSTHNTFSNNYGGLGTFNSIIDRSNSRASSRICLSFSDLSRIFTSLDTVNLSTNRSRQGLHDPETSTISLPSLGDNFLSPKACYQELPATSASLQGLELIKKLEEEQLEKQDLLHRRASDSNV